MRHGRENPRREDGFALIELLAAMLIMGFVIAAILTVGSAAERLGVRDREASNALREAQTGAYLMTRELRQAVALMPTGTAAGTCPATATANCIDFLVRSRTIDATGNHLVRRVRFDCTQAYAPPGGTDPYAGQYRTCLRYESAEGAWNATPAPATTLTRTLVPRVLNWAAGTCPGSADAAFTCPIFAYRRTLATASTGWVTANASTNTTVSNAERINVAVMVPSRGEGKDLGGAHSDLIQDAAQLRNILR